MFTLIGSRAIKDYFYRDVSCSDWDFVASIDDARQWLTQHRHQIEKIKVNSRKILVHINVPGNDRQMVEINLTERRPSDKLLQEIVERDGTICYSPTMDVFYRTPPNAILLLMKRSHLYWPVRWKKNIEDYHWMKNEWSSLKLDDDLYQRFYNLRLEEHKKIFGHKKINLNVTNDQFFERSEKFVQRVVEHDSIHEAVAYEDEPMHAQLKYDRSKAKIEKSLWDDLSERRKDNTVREEAMVIAIERYLIPNFIQDAQEAYERALQRICTNLTSGWFRDYTIERYPFVKTLDKDIVQIRNELLACGTTG